MIVYVFIYPILLLNWVAPHLARARAKGVEATTHTIILEDACCCNSMTAGWIAMNSCINDIHSIVNESPPKYYAHWIRIERSPKCL